MYCSRRCCCASSERWPVTSRRAACGLGPGLAVGLTLSLSLFLALALALALALTLTLTKARRVWEVCWAAGGDFHLKVLAVLMLSQQASE